MIAGPPRVLARFVNASLLLLAASVPALVCADDPREELMATDRAFSEQSSAEGRAAAFVDYADANALMFRDGAPPLTGLEAIRASLAKQGPGKLTWKPRDASVAASGDLGYTWGDYRFEYAHGKKVSTGHYVSIWKRQSDGHWKWVVDIGNPDPAD